MILGIWQASADVMDNDYCNSEINDPSWLKSPEEASLSMWQGYGN